VQPLARLVGVCALAAVATGVAPAAGPAATCAAAPEGYTYAGIETPRPAYGAAATVTVLSEPVVASGHVAAWVGFGSATDGPGGAPEWLQVGISALPDGTSALYYEVTLPGAPPRYVEVRRVAAGERHTLAIVQARSPLAYWQPLVDGVPAGGPFFLPHAGGWRFQAMTESWDGGAPACNRFAYAFDTVSIRSRVDGPWQPVRAANVRRDAGFRLVRDATGALVVTADG
jgi:hypothetical protein